MPEQITEARPVVEATPSPTGRIEVTLITPGWGSSGYYSAAVLEQAARDRIFAAGLQSFVDHPSQTELYDRPERSVRDLAAVLVEDARWDAAGQRLVADAQLLPPHAEVFSQPEVASTIGMSIRASADVSMGEAEGRRGRIVGQLVEAQSVDFVTRAGRGGRYQVIESATPSHVARLAVQRGVAEATANDLREWLGDVLRDAYGGEESWVWVRDFDDSTVWYEHQTPNSSGLFQHAYSETDGAVALTGDPVEVRVETRYVPVDPAAGTTTTQESLEDTMPQIEEARLGQLEEAAGRVPTLEAERDAAVQCAAAAEAERDRLRLANDARPLIAAHLAEAAEPLPAPAQARVVEAVIAAGVPANEQGIDREALNTATEAAATREAAYLAATAPAPAREAYGAFGSQQSSATTSAVAEADALAAYDRDSARTFGRTITGA